MNLSLFLFLIGILGFVLNRKNVISCNIALLSQCGLFYGYSYPYLCIIGVEINNILNILCSNIPLSLKLFFVGFIFYLYLTCIELIFNTRILKFIYKNIKYIIIFAIIIHLQFKLNIIHLDTFNGIYFSKDNLVVTGSALNTISEEYAPYMAFFAGLKAAERAVQMYPGRLGGPIQTYLFIVAGGVGTYQVLKLNMMGSKEYMEKFNKPLPSTEVEKVIVLEKTTDPMHPAALDSFVSTNTPALGLGDTIISQVFDFRIFSNLKNTNGTNLNSVYTNSINPGVGMENNSYITTNESIKNINESIILSEVYSNEAVSKPGFWINSPMINSPIEEAENKLLYLNELLSTEYILIRCVIFLVFFLISIISSILLTYESSPPSTGGGVLRTGEKFKKLLGFLDNIPLGSFIKYFLMRMLNISKTIRITWMYITLGLLAVFTISISIGLTYGLQVIN